jgi:hypothetical protein
VTNHFGSPSGFDDLIADAAVVARVLDLPTTTVELPPVEFPRQGGVVVTTGVIPDRALAMVSGLDSYGD